MQTRMMNLFLIAALSTALIGCQSDGDTDADANNSADNDRGPQLAQPVAIGKRARGSSDALKAIGAYHIETQEQYDALGDPNLFPGELDFSENDLVIIALGQQPTGGYSVTIESIQLEGGDLAVTGKASAPSEDAATTQALTYPYSAVSIPNTEADKVVPYID